MLISSYDWCNETKTIDNFLLGKMLGFKLYNFKICNVITLLIYYTTPS
jgi:hypothetical protein